MKLDTAFSGQDDDQSLTAGMTDVGALVSVQTLSLVPTLQFLTQLDPQQLLPTT